MKYINADDMKKDKKEYRMPEIKLISMDNEISLNLQSEPTFGPDETMNMQAPEFYNNELF